MTWDDAAKTLSIGQRKGSFKGMLATRQFRIRLMGTDHMKTVTYDGKELQVKF